AEAVVTGDHQLPATADGGIDALERGGPVGKGGLRERGSGDEGEEHSKAFHGGAAYPTSKSFGRSSPALPRRHSSKECAFSGRSRPTYTQRAFPTWRRCETNPAAGWTAPELPTVRKRSHSLSAA